MFAEERKKAILETLYQKGSVKVTDLASVLEVTEATIRRDLQELEEKKMLQRTHGGAVPMDSTKFEPTLLERKDSHYNEKVAIGRKAAEMIEEGDSILIDAGTTTLQIAKHLSTPNITIVTNSMPIALEMENHKDVELILIGGMIRWNTQAFVGPLAEEMLRKIRVDKVFIGTNAITLEDGLTTPNLLEAKMKQTMLGIASQKIVVCDSSKFGKRSFAKICDVEDVDVIITSGEKAIEKADEYIERGVELVII